MSIHIGKEIEKIVREQRMTVVDLSRELGCNRTKVYRIFDAPTIDSGILARLSIILEFDFFKLYSEELALKLSENGLAQ